MSELSFGQRRDPENNLVQCWFTHGALDWICEQNWSDKIVWMWGSGLGDVWLAKRCKELHVVERNEEWIYKNQELISANKADNIKYYFRPCNEGSGKQDFYCEIPSGVRPDIFIVDDAYRYECILKALEFKPCILVVDNFDQDYVFICPAAVEALKEYDGKLYPQLDHTNHEGKCWKTGIWNIK